MTSRILSTPAIIEPITRAEAKAHLQVDPDFLDDDPIIDRLIITARQYVEHRTRKLMAQANVEMYLDDLPLEVEFPWYPVEGLVSISYKDVNNQDASISINGNGDVILNKWRLPAKLVLLNNPKTYKSVQSYSVNNVTITFQAGYGSASWPLPEPLRQAMLVCVRDMYDNRESRDGKKGYTMPLAAENLINDNSIYQFH